MADQHIFFEIVDLYNPAPEPFAVLRIDTTKRVENGVEGVVHSLHMTREEAEAAAAHQREIHLAGGFQ